MAKIQKQVIFLQAGVQREIGITHIIDTSLGDVKVKVYFIGLDYFLASFEIYKDRVKLD